MHMSPGIVVGEMEDLQGGTWRPMSVAASEEWGMANPW